MISHLSPQFRKLFEALPRDVQLTARKNYGLWKEDPTHPSLEFKKSHTKRDVDSIRIGLGWRALGVVEDDRITWFWIGSHNAYNKLLSQL